jgi:multiple sugar transport system substrate-binding protein
VTSVLRYSVIAQTANFGAQNIGILRWPSSSGQKPAPTPLAGWWIAAWRNSPRLKEAAKFVEFAVNPQSAALWTTVGGQVPIRMSVAASGALDKPEMEWMRNMIMAWGESSWIEPSECNTRNLQGVLNEAVARVLFDKAKPLDALKEAEKKFAEAQ